MSDNWGEYQDAYGEASEIGTLLHSFIEFPTKQLHQQLHGRLVHQGWRFTASARALECLAEVVASRPDRLRGVCELVFDLACGDILSSFPHLTMRCENSLAMQAAMQRCAPAEVASQCRALAIALREPMNKLLSDELWTVRIVAEHFEHIFFGERSGCIGEYEASAQFAQICLCSLKGDVVGLERSSHTWRFTCRGFSLEVARDEMDAYPVFAGAWEIALLQGVIKKGKGALLLLDELAETKDEWAVGFYHQCRRLLCDLV